MPSQEHTVTLHSLANTTLEELAVRMAKVEELLGVVRDRLILLHQFAISNGM
jgi:hypothetical protein